MKTLLVKSLFLCGLSAMLLSCGTSRAEAERKRQERKQKSDQLDQDKKRFEMQHDKDLK